MSDLSDAHLAADHALKLLGLIRRLVDRYPDDRCPVCGPYDARLKDGTKAPLHILKDCPWPELVAEAEKP